MRRAEPPLKTRTASRLFARKPLAQIPTKLDHKIEQVWSDYFGLTCSLQTFLFILKWLSMVKNGEDKKLIGEFESKVVAGHRIAVPSQLRKALTSNCIIARGYEESLILVPKDKWSLLVQPLEESSFFDRNIRDTLRFLVGSSYEVDFDKQGRIVVPQVLRSYSHIEFSERSAQELVFVGLINWVEIWNKSVWEQRVSYLENNADTIAQELALLKKP